MSDSVAYITNPVLRYSEIETEDEINIFIRPGAIVRYVEYNEILRPEYLIRDKYESPMLSQDGGWDTSFKADNWRGTAWHTIQHDLPYWIGETYDKYDISAMRIHEIIEVSPDAILWRKDSIAREIGKMIIK